MMLVIKNVVTIQLDPLAMKRIVGCSYILPFVNFDIRYTNWLAPTSNVDDHSVCVLGSQAPPMSRGSTWMMKTVGPCRHHILFFS